MIIHNAKIKSRFWGRWSKIVITNLMKLLQNPDFVGELKLKLEMVRGLKMATGPG